MSQMAFSFLFFAAFPVIYIKEIVQQKRQLKALVLFQIFSRKETKQSTLPYLFK